LKKLVYFKQSLFLFVFISSEFIFYNVGGYSTGIDSETG